MRPICIACSRFYSPEKTGDYFIEGMPTEVPACGTTERHTAKPGLLDAKFWQPYKLWVGDLWKCPGCGHQIISGTGRQPIAEHYQKDFAEQAKVATFQVNDC